jgi:choline dehydrogenase-like flavoprotein
VKTMHQSAGPTRMGSKFQRELADASDVEVLLFANALELLVSERGDRVSAVRAGTLAGHSFLVHADAFVLASGAVENARLLLASRAHHPHGIGNGHDLVGRHFMEHPRVPHAARVVWAGGTPFGKQRDDMMRVLRQLSYVVFTPSEAVQREQQLLHCALRLQGDPPTGDEGAREIIALTRALAGPHGVPRVDDVRLYVEQIPCPASRVLLTDERDALGMPKAVLQWRTHADQTRQMERTLQLFAHELGRSARGRAQLLLDADAPFSRGAYFGSHMMGTTRMAADPERGVVDGDCKIHDVDNVYVAGSSVFATAGFANPTLTIVALALRLGAHLATHWRARSGPWR